MLADDMEELKAQTELYLNSLKLQLQEVEIYRQFVTHLISQVELIHNYYNGDDSVRNLVHEATIANKTTE